MQASISTTLLNWYDSHARDLPWRAPPGMPAPDPYRVWLSEIMLQQTTVAAVKPYFAAFTKRWPTIDALADAGEEAVMAAWAGLGYYSRARNLHACARVVAGRGGFPETERSLRDLPGVGDYTAAAIAAIAFGQRAVVVDANVERVIARLFAIDTPLPAARKAIRAAADTITPDKRAGDFAQAMMDLGSQVCTPRDPKCLICPIAENCEALRQGDPARLPIKPVKQTKPERRGSAYWIEREGEVWLVKRPSKGMLGGMRALPDDGWSARADGADKPPLDASWEACGSVAHVFTHARLTLDVWKTTASATPPGSGEWWPIERLEEAGLPSLFKAAAARAMAA